MLSLPDLLALLDVDLFLSIALLGSFICFSEFFKPSSLFIFYNTKLEGVACVCFILITLVAEAKF